MECRAVPEIYEYLWKEKTTRQEEASQYGKLRVSIPDTVVYMFAKAQAWYFTNAAGQVMRRAQLHSQKVIDRMTPSGESGIAAFAVPSIQGDREHFTGIQYFDDEGLADALTRDGLPDHAILQKFIAPKPVVRGQAKNRLIQSLWQPHHFLVARWENLHLLSDMRYSREERAETVEGTRHSMSSQLQSPVLLNHLKELSNGIAEHLFYVADLVTKSMQLCWKVDTHHKVQLLWCSQLETVTRADADKGAYTMKLLPSNPRLYLSHQRHLKRLAHRQRKIDSTQYTVQEWTPEHRSEASDEEEEEVEEGDGGGGGAGGVRKPVYRPPASALVVEGAWGEALPSVRGALMMPPDG